MSRQFHFVVNAITCEKGTREKVQEKIYRTYYI